jgi:hypothetical protein
LKKALPPRLQQETAWAYLPKSSFTEEEKTASFLLVARMVPEWPRGGIGDASW